MRDLGPKIHTHEFWVVLVSIGLPAFLRKCLPSLQWLKLLLWPCFEGLYQIAALSHPCTCWLPPAPRKSLILCLCLCSSSIRDITSRLLAQQIKDGKFQPAPAHLVFLPLEWLCSFQKLFSLSISGVAMLALCKQNFPVCHFSQTTSVYLVAHALTFQ